MARVTPMPFPSTMRDDTNSELYRAGVTSPEQRYVIRSLIAEAYAQGYAAGRLDQSINDAADRTDARETKA